MKRLFCVMITLIVLLALTACNNETPPPTINFVGETAKFEVNTYVVDEWREDFEDGNRKYHTILLTYSDGISDMLTVDNLKFTTEAGTKTFTEVFSDSTIEIVTVNNENNIGTCAYIFIETPKLIDMKKVHVLVEGSKEYKEGINTKEEYIKQNGSADGWYAILTNVVNKTPPYNAIENLYTNKDGGIIRLFDDGRSQYKYEFTENVGVINGSSIETEIQVIPLKQSPVETFLDGFIAGCAPVNLVDGEYVESELDERITISGRIVNGVVYLGFSTTDNSDFSNYDGEIPYALMYLSDTEHVIVINQN